VHAVRTTMHCWSPFCVPLMNIIGLVGVCVQYVSDLLAWCPLHAESVVFVDVFISYAASLLCRAIRTPPGLGLHALMIVLPLPLGAHPVHLWRGSLCRSSAFCVLIYIIRQFSLVRAARTTMYYYNPSGLELHSPLIFLYSPSRSASSTSLARCPLHAESVVFVDVFISHAASLLCRAIRTPPGLGLHALMIVLPLPLGAHPVHLWRGSLCRSSAFCVLIYIIRQFSLVRAARTTMYY